MYKIFLIPFFCLLSFEAAGDIVPDTLVINDRGINVLMAYRARLEGGITHNPIRGYAFAEKDNDLVYGFTNVNDKITWTVRVPKTAEYRVGVQFSGKNFQSDDVQLAKGKPRRTWPDPDCTVEITANGKSIYTKLPRLTSHNESPKIAGRRQWFDVLLPLKKGVNTITLRFSEISDLQIQYAKKELEVGILKKSSNSIGIKDIVLVRPQVWESMKARAAKLKPDLSWMIEGKYGLFTHWSLLTYPLYGDKKAYETFEWGVNKFDVEAYADAVAETGASWVIFTTCHGMQMFPAPLKTLDDVMPGRTTKRDLIAELADALNKRNIKLLLYYNLSPGDDISIKLGINSGNPERWFKYLIDLAREISLRYGKKIAGWGYLDSTVPAYTLNMPWEEYYKALKAGNPDAVVGISSHWWAEYSPFNDLQTGDSGGSLILPLDSRLYEEGQRYEGLQQHWSFVLDGSWIPRAPYNGVIRSTPNHEAGPGPYTDEEYIEYFKAMAAARVPITVNLLITQDVTRDQPFMNSGSIELMRKIKEALGK